MYELLKPLAIKPVPFSVYTTPEFWNDPHVAAQMLKWHLDPNSDPASYRHNIIDSIVDWLDQALDLAGKSVCDLGCGPGLYTDRFHQRGARVTGFDISQNSLAWAKENSGSGVKYVKGNYLSDELPRNMNIVTMISQDYTAISPSQRKILLTKVHDSLLPGGRFVFDAQSEESFADVTEDLLVEPRLMDGFWSANDYIGMKKTHRYEEEKISLDYYLVIEPERQWQVYNWSQFLSSQALVNELETNGFTIEFLGRSLTGKLQDDRPGPHAVIAKAI